MNMNILPSDIIVNVKLTNNLSGFLLAQAEVAIGCIKTTGWQILMSKYVDPNIKDRVFVKPPSFKDRSDNWHPTVYLEDKELFGIVEAKILEAYNRLQNEQVGEQPSSLIGKDLTEIDEGIKKQTEEESKDMDNIPF